MGHESKEMTIELKPCPFCGEVLTVKDIHFANNGTYNVHCGFCEAQVGSLHKGEYGSPKEAIEAWNNRTYEPEMNMLLELVQKLVLAREQELSGEALYMRTMHRAEEYLKERGLKL